MKLGRWETATAHIYGPIPYFLWWMQRRLSCACASPSRYRCVDTVTSW
uniref:Uncharacterized protein n=1 Tax=Physcomitrium patens TaxID=3218 RepID=A0A2K1JRL5_PHYPA|nr:hypothetical protein PHYPA_016555 [Physcomitrium patens]